MKVAVIANHPMCLPAVEFLANSGYLAGLAIEPAQTPVASQLQAVAGQLGKPFAVLEGLEMVSTLEQWLGQTEADAVFVMGLGQFIPEPILAKPRLGFLNFHGGPLPGFRGPQPVFWQIRNGEAKLELTVHKMTGKLDAGEVAYSESIPLTSTDTYGTANYKLPTLALNATRAIVERFGSEAGLEFTPQDEEQASYQDRPGPLDIVIDWKKHLAAEIATIARAANPTFVGAVFSLGGGPAYVPQATEMPDLSGDETPGTVLSSSGESGLLVRCAGQTTIRIDLLSTDLGVFTGDRAVSIFGIGDGDVLQNQAV